MTVVPQPDQTSDHRIARAILERIGQLERAVAFSAFLVLIGVLFADVASREVTGAGITWARQIGIYANLFIILAGIGIASARGAHLRPRIADRWFPAPWNPLLDRLQDAFMAFFCLSLAILAALAVAETRLLDERTANPRWLVWPFQAFLPLTFLIACLRHALYAGIPGLAPRPEAGPPQTVADAAGASAEPD